MLPLTKFSALSILGFAGCMSATTSIARADTVRCYPDDAIPRCEINLSPALAIHTDIDGIDDIGNQWRFEITGDVELVATDMTLPLADTSLVLELDPVTGGLTEFYGTAVLPLNEWDLLENADLVASPPTAVIGYFQAATLEQIFYGQLPLNTAVGPDGSFRDSPQPYMVFHTSTGGLKLDLNQMLGLGMGENSSFALNIANENSFTLALDMVDPYIFSGQGFSASFEIKGDDGSARIEQVEYFHVKTELVLDENSEVLMETIKHFDSNGNLVKQFHHDPVNGALEKEFYNADGTVVTSHYLRDPDGNMVNVGGDSTDTFNMFEVDNGIDVDNPNRLRKTGYRTRSYQVTDKEGNTWEVIEYLDPRGEMTSRFSIQPDGVTVKRNDFSGDGMSDAVTYQMDAEGDFVKTDTDKNTGNYFTANELKRGVDVDNTQRVRNDEPPADTNQKRRHKFDLGLDAYAFSYNGWLPYKASNTFGVPEDSRAFSGQLYMKGAITMDGMLVLDGETVTYIGEQGFVMGGNGDLAFTLPDPTGLIDFSLYLGSASSTFHISEEKQMTFLSGVVAPDTRLFGKILPLTPSLNMLAAGYIDNQLGEAHITLDGEFSLGAQIIGELTGLPLQELKSVNGYASVNSQGVEIYGKTRDQIHPDIQLSNEIQVDAVFSWENPEDFTLRLTGSIELFGVNLEEASIEINSTGMYVNGIFITPLSHIAMQGKITDQGPSLTGTGSVMFGLEGISQAMQDATAKLTAAQAKVDKLTYEIDLQRGIVQAERSSHINKLSDARSTVSAAQSQVNTLNSRIANENKSIATRRAQVKSWYRWYKKAKWHQRASRYARYLKEKTWRTADISRRYAVIASLKASVATAKMMLDTAKLTLQSLENAAVTTPVDLDLRVASLITAKEAALLTLEIAKAPFKNVPPINYDFEGKISATLDITGIYGSVIAEFDGYKALHGTVNFAPSPEACIEFSGIGLVCTRL